MYDLILVEDCNNVNEQYQIKEELKIKTHYENLDLAKSNKIFYLKFSLPQKLKDIDHQLLEIVNHEENDA